MEELKNMEELKINEDYIYTQVQENITNDLKINNNIVQDIIDNVNKEHRKEIYFNALYYECVKKNYDMDKIKVLLYLMDDINRRDKDGITILIRTILSHNNNIEIVKYLIDNGADVNIRDINNVSALHYASYHNKLDTVKYLIDNGAKINIINTSGYTPLDVANGSCTKYIRNRGGLYTVCFGFKY